MVFYKKGNKLKTSTILAKLSHVFLFLLYLLHLFLVENLRLQAKGQVDEPSDYGTIVQVHKSMGKIRRPKASERLRK